MVVCQNASQIKIFTRHKAYRSNRNLTCLVANKQLVWMAHTGRNSHRSHPFHVAWNDNCYRILFITSEELVLRNYILTHPFSQFTHQCSVQPRQEKRSDAWHQFSLFPLHLFESPANWLNQPSLTESRRHIKSLALEWRWSGLKSYTDWKISMFAPVCTPWSWPWATFVKGLIYRIDTNLNEHPTLAGENGTVSLISCHQLDFIYRFTLVSCLRKEGKQQYYGYYQEVLVMVKTQSDRYWKKLYCWLGDILRSSFMWLH